MKILNTITYKVLSGYHGAWMEHQRHYIRRHKLTYTGAERMIRRGAPEHPPVPDAVITQIETEMVG